MDRPALQHASATAWKTQVPAAEVVAAPAMSASRPVVTQAATPVSAPVATQVILTQAAYATNTGGGAARPRTNWGDLLARRSQPNRATTLVTTSVTAQTAPAQAPHADARRDLLDAVVAETSSQNAQAPDVAVPAGFHDGFVLSRLVQSHKPVSGLVVSIGVSATQEAGGAQGESDSAPVRNLIQSLMGPQDFACASGPDEYLLIFPQERGAAAQRRLSAISQKLWDFQLQALGAASILFSWGGVEVRGESIEEAIASASERMQETRRGRSAKSFDTQALKIAV
jgi:hypothetical protein